MFVVVVLKIDHVTVDKRFVSFNWTDAVGPKGVKYIVRYTKYDKEGRGTLVNLETAHRSITVRGLTPYTQYIFTLLRDSLVSKGSAVSLTRKTRSDVPSAPVDVTARSNDSWVLINWQVPLYPNGEIQTYKVLYTTDNTQRDEDRIPKDVGGMHLITVLHPLLNTRKSFFTHPPTHHAPSLYECVDFFFPLVNVFPSPDSRSVSAFRTPPPPVV